MSQKKWKFNIIDAIALVVILAAVVFLGIKVMDTSTASSTPVTIRYTVLVENQPDEMVDALEKYIPGQLMASGALCDLNVISMDAVPTMVPSNGTFIEDPNHVDITLVVEGTILRDEVLVASAGNQEIRIGREIILKTEYMEFPKGLVVDVEYPAA